MSDEAPLQEILERLEWRKASFSQLENCVQVAALDDQHIVVRDSKNPGGETLVFGSTQFKAWLEGVKLGELDGLVS